MVDIIDEIKESDSNQKKIFYYKRFLILLVIVSIITVIGMIVHDTNKNKREYHRKEMIDALMESTQDQDVDSKLTLKKLQYVILNANNSVKEVAHLKLLFHMTSRNNLVEAKKVVADILSAANYNDITKSYAKIQLLGIMIDQENLDKDEHQFVENIFASFDKDSMPFWGTATMYRALWSQKIENPQDAEKYFEMILNSKYTSEYLKEEVRIIRGSGIIK